MPNPSDKEKIVFRDVVDIDENAQIKFKSKYYNGVADTTYQLSNNIIKKLNNIFNGSNSLNSYMVTNKLRSGSHFAGPLQYLKYVDGHNKTFEFIIVFPFMAERFNEALRNLVILPTKANRDIKEIDDSKLEGRIFKTQKASMYIPKIEEPPPMM